MKKRDFLKTTALLLLTVASGRLSAKADENPNNLPTIYLIGDSTVNNGTKGLEGWGSALAPFFDTTKVNVVNRAKGGRSSRSYLTEGLWDEVAARLKPGDFVLMQFGHNDGGPLFTERARASLKGSGEETQDGLNTTTQKNETVHTYGWYLRKYVTDSKAKGATPIVLSPVSRNRWGEDGKVFRSTDYGKWASDVATAEGVPFVNLNGIISDRYDAMGKDKVAALFLTDWTHTNPDGAEINASCVVAGLKEMENKTIDAYLSARGAAVGAAK